ncbi:D-2-hydroxyacid dehydrogenase family protein [Aeromonas bivalvium]|uniref:D-2-hydroxyacid dehydrogenase family protein n=1 Tax=Aeromonas bivalvium TaxID=440079 RepID=UPI0038D11EA5
MKIAILDDYQEASRTLACFDKLAGHEVTLFRTPAASRAELVERLRPFEALVLIRERTRIDERLLARLPRLRLVSQTGKVSQHLDLAACSRHGVLVVEGSGSPVAPSELCWALILAASRHLPAYWHGLRQGQWQESGPLGLGRSLSGLTLGIWGFGKIGRKVAAFGQAFGMRVLVWGSEASREAAEGAGYLAAPCREALFGQSYVLSLHLRLCDQTRHCVGHTELALMKPDALLVNISRAELLAPGALLAALSAGRPGFAALDVFEQEPLGRDPLLAMANVIATPHLGYVTRDSYECYLGQAFDNLLAFAAGAPVNMVNPSCGWEGRVQETPSA